MPIFKELGKFVAFENTLQRSTWLHTIQARSPASSSSLAALAGLWVPPGRPVRTGDRRLPAEGAEQGEPTRSEPIQLERFFAAGLCPIPSTRARRYRMFSARVLDAATQVIFMSHQWTAFAEPDHTGESHHTGESEFPSFTFFSLQANNMSRWSWP